MFEPATHGSGPRKLSLVASLLVHLVAAYLCLKSTPVFVKPSSTALGQHGRSDTLIYFPRAVKSERAARNVPAPPREKEKRAKKAVQSPVESARAGRPLGSVFSGPLAGREARPAFPVVFPDPAIYSWQLPKGLEGDVVIEITIDNEGKVIETRVLQSFAAEIDAKVTAALRSWRFQPARVDGVAVSSRQDVHFHFPS